MAGWPIGGTQRLVSIGANAAASTGTTITADATAHTKGAWTELTASTGLDLAAVRVVVAGSTDHVGYLVDIGIGAAASETVLVPDLLYNGEAGGVAEFVFPVAIPSGTRVSARCQSSAGSSTCSVALVGSAATWGPHVPYSRVEALGVSAATSAGTDVDPGATANTKGAWSEISASTSAPLKGIVPAVTGGGDTTLSAGDFLLDIGIGAAGSEEVLVPDLWFVANAVIDMLIPPSLGMIPVDIPAGTRVAARAQSSITTNRVVDLALYGVV